MKFKFKIQQYQTDAVENTVSVFAGQPSRDSFQYKRDLGKGINPDIPVNYYPDDNPENKPLLLWRSHSMNLYTNWLNYYVYQVTPYEL